MRLHYQDTRQGTHALVFLHGFPFHGGLWEPQLADLPRSWRGIAPDLRGFGLSVPWHPGQDPLTMERHADDVVQLLDRLGIERAVFCGLSMGGYVCFALWRKHRERVRAFVLCDTRAGADSEEARRGRRMTAAKVEREGALAIADAMRPKLFARATHERRPEVVATVEAMMLGTPPGTIVRSLEGLAERPDSTELLETIDVPTLVVVGEEDAITPPTEAELIAARVHGARLVRVPDAGHLSSIEQPATFNREMKEFVEGLAAVM